MEKIVKFNEADLRPSSLNDYKGQEKVKKQLTFYIKAAKMRGDCLDHTIIYGPSGLGKTTLSYIIGNEMGSHVTTVAGPALKKPEDLVNLLLDIEEGEILFIDEIHRLNMKVEEMLYFAMEDFRIDAKIDGEQKRIDLPRFTLIGATTIKGMLTEPLRNRFHIAFELKPYEKNHLAEIIKSSLAALGSDISDECAIMIAQRSRGVPRVANGYAKRVQDFALVMNEGIVTEDVILEAFDFLEVDENGLTDQDLRYLKILVKDFKLKAVGLDTLCSAMNEDKRTIENSIEPYLLQNGFVRRTPRGRVATDKSYEIIG